jgi:soluble lytic murein transglycosylase-like protein
MKDVLRWRELVEAVTAGHGLDVKLVLAMIAQESSGDPYAHNPEPHYRYLVDVQTGKPFRKQTAAEIASEYPPDDFFDLRGFRGKDADQEWWNQQASFGLLQVMGAVARERGFNGFYLTALSEPWRGVYYGVQQLVYLRKRFGTGDDLLATYNGGPGAKGKNRGYVAAVHEQLGKLEGI